MCNRFYKGGTENRAEGGGLFANSAHSKVSKLSPEYAKLIRQIEKSTKNVEKMQQRLSALKNKESKGLQVAKDKISKTDANRKNDRRKPVPKQKSDRRRSVPKQKSSSRSHSNQRKSKQKTSNTLPALDMVLHSGYKHNTNSFPPYNNPLASRSFYEIVVEGHMDITRITSSKLLASTVDSPESFPPAVLHSRKGSHVALACSGAVEYWYAVKGDPRELRLQLQKFK